MTKTKDTGADIEAKIERLPTRIEQWSGDRKDLVELYGTDTATTISRPATRVAIRP